MTLRGGERKQESKSHERHNGRWEAENSPTARYNNHLNQTTRHGNLQDIALHQNRSSLFAKTILAQDMSSYNGTIKASRRGHIIDSLWSYVQWLFQSHECEEAYRNPAK
jgi:hypothetical protein